MTKYPPYAVFLFLVVGIAAPACADGIPRNYDGRRIGEVGTLTDTQRDQDYTGRPSDSGAVNQGPEIVIDKYGRRIGLAIPDLHGKTNNDLLRLRSGKGLGNQVFDATGRRAGTIIRK